MHSRDPHPDWRALIKAARSGDTESLDRFCQNLLPTIRRISRTQLPPALKGKLSESDLVQESLLGASANINSLEGSGTGELMAWIQTIVENKAIDLRRRYLLAEKRDVSREQSLSQQYSSRLEIVLEDSTQSPLEKIVSVEQARHIQQLVAELPQDYQDVLQLRHRDGLSFPEIAKRLQRTEPAVKNVYVRAVTVLKRQLSGD